MGTMANFYKVIVQTVLLYGSESWVLTQKMWKAIERFHNSHNFHQKSLAQRLHYAIVHLDHAEPAGYADVSGLPNHRVKDP